jgi:capsular exopolysaccharide synthesis family protein
MRRARGEDPRSDPAGAVLTGEPTELVVPASSETVPAAPINGTTVATVGADQLSAANEREDAKALAEHLQSSLAGKVVVHPDIAPASREQYRRLAATLLHAQATNGLRVVMVTSAAVGEGKSLTASNLALTFSESYKRRVLLIDADLRRPSLHQLFGFTADTGLSDALMLTDDQQLPLHAASSRLSVVPAGAPTSDPMAGLSSLRMRHIIDEARDAFDWVIVDTPPVGLLSDASLLSAMVDGVVLVVKANATPYDLVQRAIDAVGRERVLGVVLNLVAPDLSPAYHAYGEYYGASRSAP